MSEQITTIEEFEDNNPNIKETTDNKSGGVNRRERLYVDEEVGYGFRYLFYFENDTLFAVYNGFWHVILQKEIDYDKYATPPE